MSIEKQLSKLREKQGNEAIQFHLFVSENFYTNYGRKEVYRMRQQNVGGIIDPMEYTLTELYDVFSSNFETWNTNQIKPKEDSDVFTYFDGRFGVCEYIDGAFIETYRCIEVPVSHWKYAKEPKTK